jgi:hypothetical protein
MRRRIESPAPAGVGESVSRIIARPETRQESSFDGTDTTRRGECQPDEEQSNVSPFLQSLGGPRKTKPRKKTIGNGALNTAVGEASAMARSGDWTDAKAIHFLAVYIVFHERIYKVFPTDLTPEVRHRARFMVANFLEREFGGDTATFADYMRYSWQREAAIEETTRKEHRDRGRISWYTMFTNGYLLTNYRVHLARVAR